MQVDRVGFAFNISLKDLSSSVKIEKYLTKDILKHDE